MDTNKIKEHLKAISELIEPKPWSLGRSIPNFRPLRDGEEWHCGNQPWIESDLPSGYRPVLVGEETKSGDDCWSGGLGPWSTKHSDGGPLGSGCTKFRTTRPLPEPVKRVPWDDTADFPKVPSLWIRSANDYREHLVIGFANPCAIITVTCGCMPVLQSIHLTQDGFKGMEWSEDRKNWSRCEKEVIS